MEEQPRSSGTRGKEIKVILPPGLPQLTPEAARIMLEILIELATSQGFKFDGKERSEQADASPPARRDLPSDRLHS